MNDIWLPRIVVSCIGSIGLTSVIGSVLMQKPPDWFSSLALATITGLLGYLTPSPLAPHKSMLSADSPKYPGLKL